jgi:hypothetical protein
VSHCHGSPAAFIEADCGDVGPHDEHEFTDAERQCLGSPAAFIEASCGHVGPHGQHPLNMDPPALDGESE